MQLFHQDLLDAKQLIRWNEFLLSSPRSHYMQSPDWAEVERLNASIQQREPSFFWAENDGEILLSALIVRHRLLFAREIRLSHQQGPCFQ